ncbi:hypothetical protein BGZ76_011705 [Entomortierella beljakovae]|nr:hypothetical protein BGZ76_011705 [Entomortierella beljakovae]
MAKASGSIYLVITLYAFFQIMTHLWPRHHKSPSNSIATSLLKRFIPNDNSNELQTGVTFLAFGNASPDIFSTFSAIGAGSGTLAIGEVVGAAAFTTSVVVGSMMIAKPFEVYRKPFLRDTVVFTGSLVVYGNCSNEGQGQEVEPLDSQYEQVPEEGEQKRISLQSTIDCEDGNGSQGNPDQRRFTIAIQDDLSHLDISNCNCRIPPVLSCDPKSPKPSTSWSPSTPINTYTHLPSSLSTTPKTSHSGFNLLGHGLGGCSCITPPTENGVSYAQFQQAVLHHSLILPDRSDPAAHPKSPIFQDSSRRHYFQENIPSITITTECASSVFNDWTIPVLFPTLLRWKEKTWWARLLSVGSIPIVFVLNLTLPVVDLVEATEAKEGCLPLTHDGREECSSLVGRDVIGEDLIFDNWCKSSTMIQMIFAPLLIATTTDVAGKSF